MTPDQIIEVVTAFKNGKKIEAHHKIMGDWHVAVPAWDFHQFNYRVKPEPMELWVNEMVDGRWYSYPTKKDALKASSLYNQSAFARKAVLFREVIGADVENGDK